MGNFAARHSARLIMTGCHIRAATAKASIRSLAERTLSMTIVQEITFALLAAVGAVAGSELIVLVWQFLQLLR